MQDVVPQEYGAALLDMRLERVAQPSDHTASAGSSARVSC